jgi:hypothetical protein
MPVAPVAALNANVRMNTLAAMVRDVSFMSGCTHPQTVVAIQALFQVAADELHQRKSFTVAHYVTIVANHNDQTFHIVFKRAFEREVFRQPPPAINAYTC